MNFYSDCNEALEETVYPNCTVIVYRNTATGQQQIMWYNNEEPPIQYEEYEEE